jgi:hypothetical protein
MADGTFVSWLAVDGDKIIDTSGMSFVEKPPYYGYRLSESPARINTGFLRPDFSFSPTYFPTF